MIAMDMLPVDDKYYLTWHYKFEKSALRTSKINSLHAATYPQLSKISLTVLDNERN